MSAWATYNPSIAAAAGGSAAGGGFDQITGVGSALASVSSERERYIFETGMAAAVQLSSDGDNISAERDLMRLYQKLSEVVKKPSRFEGSEKLLYECRKCLIDVYFSEEMMNESNARTAIDLCLENLNGQLCCTSSRSVCEEREYLSLNFRLSQLSFYIKDYWTAKMTLVLRGCSASDNRRTIYERMLRESFARSSSANSYGSHFVLNKLEHQGHLRSHNNGYRSEFKNALFALSCASEQSLLSSSIPNNSNSNDSGAASEYLHILNKIEKAFAICDKFGENALNVYSHAKLAAAKESFLSNSLTSSKASLEGVNSFPAGISFDDIFSVLSDVDVHQRNIDQHRRHRQNMSSNAMIEGVFESGSTAVKKGREFYIPKQFDDDSMIDPRQLYHLLHLVGIEGTVAEPDNVLFAEFALDHLVMKFFQTNCIAQSDPRDLSLFVYVGSLISSWADDLLVEVNCNDSINNISSRNSSSNSSSRNNDSNINSNQCSDNMMFEEKSDTRDSREHSFLMYRKMWIYSWYLLLCDISGYFNEYTSNSVSGSSSMGPRGARSQIMKISEYLLRQAELFISNEERGSSSLICCPGFIHLGDIFGENILNLSKIASEYRFANELLSRNDISDVTLDSVLYFDDYKKFFSSGCNSSHVHKFINPIMRKVLRNFDICLRSPPFTSAPPLSAIVTASGLEPSSSDLMGDDSCGSSATNDSIATQDAFLSAAVSLLLEYVNIIYSHSCSKLRCFDIDETISIIHQLILQTKQFVRKSLADGALSASVVAHFKKVTEKVFQLINLLSLFTYGADGPKCVANLTRLFEAFSELLHLSMAIPDPTIGTPLMNLHSILSLYILRIPYILGMQNCTSETVSTFFVSFFPLFHDNKQSIISSALWKDKAIKSLFSCVFDKFSSTYKCTNRFMDIDTSVILYSIVFKDSFFAASDLMNIIDLFHSFGFIIDANFYSRDQGRLLRLLSYRAISNLVMVDSYRSLRLGGFGDRIHLNADDEVKLTLHLLQYFEAVFAIKLSKSHHHGAVALRSIERDDMPYIYSLLNLCIREKKLHSHVDLKFGVYSVLFSVLKLLNSSNAANNSFNGGSILSSIFSYSSEAHRSQYNNQQNDDSISYFIETEGRELLQSLNLNHRQLIDNDRLIFILTSTIEYIASSDFYANPPTNSNSNPNSSHNPNPSVASLIAPSHLSSVLLEATESQAIQSLNLLLSYMSPGTVHPIYLKTILLYICRLLDRVMQDVEADVINSLLPPDFHNLNFTLSKGSLQSSVNHRSSTDDDKEENDRNMLTFLVEKGYGRCFVKRLSEWNYFNHNRELAGTEESFIFASLSNAGFHVIVPPSGVGSLSTRERERCETAACDVLSLITYLSVLRESYIRVLFLFQQLNTSLIDYSISVAPKRTTRTLQDGDKVEANYRGRGRWYPGTISKLREEISGGKLHYDVLYDDGDTEIKLPEDLIRFKLSSYNPEYIEFQDFLYIYLFSECYRKSCKLRHKYLQFFLCCLPPHCRVVDSEGDVSMSVLSGKLQFQLARTSLRIGLTPFTSIINSGPAAVPPAPHSTPASSSPFDPMMLMHMQSDEDETSWKGLATDTHEMLFGPLEELNVAFKAELNLSSTFGPKSNKKKTADKWYNMYQYFSCLAKYNLDVIDEVLLARRSESIMEEGGGGAILFDASIFRPQLENILIAIKGLKDIRKSFSFDFLSVYRVSDIIFRLHHMRLDIPEDILGEFAAFDIADLSLETCLLELSKLFDKKRPQIVAIWTMDKSENFRDQIFQSLIKFNKARRKYISRYLYLANQCGKIQPILDVLQYTLRAKKDIKATERWVVINCCMYIHDLFAASITSTSSSSNMSHLSSSTTNASTAVITESGVAPPSGLSLSFFTADQLFSLVKLLTAVIGTLSDCIPQSTLKSVIRVLAISEAFATEYLPKPVVSPRPSSSKVTFAGVGSSSSGLSLSTTAAGGGGVGGDKSEASSAEESSPTNMDHSAFEDNIDTATNAVTANVTTTTTTTTTAVVVAAARDRSVRFSQRSGGGVAASGSTAVQRGDADREPRKQARDRDEFSGDTHNSNHDSNNDDNSNNDNNNNNSSSSSISSSSSSSSEDSSKGIDSSHGHDNIDRGSSHKGSALSSSSSPSRQSSSQSEISSSSSSFSSDIEGGEGGGSNQSSPLPRSKRSRTADQPI